MSLFAFAIPQLPGKADRHRELARSVGASAEARALHDKAGIERLRVFQQDTAQGTFSIVVWDTDDGMRAAKTIMSAPDEFGEWFRSELVDIHGPDAIDPDAMVAPELVANWSAPDDEQKRVGSWAFIVPIGKGRVDAYRSMVEEMFSGSQRDGFVETRRLLGVTRQTMFLLQTPMGDFALPVLEGPGASRVFAEQLQRDDHPFFGWWRDQIRMVTGRIPTNPPKVEMLLDLQVRQRVTSRR